MGTFAVVASGFEPARLEAHPAHESIHSVVDATDEQFYEHGREVVERCDPDQPVLVVHVGSR